MHIDTLDLNQTQEIKDFMIEKRAEAKRGQAKALEGV
jgi:hypothetical protein